MLSFSFFFFSKIDLLFSVKTVFFYVLINKLRTLWPFVHSSFMLLVVLVWCSSCIVFGGRFFFFFVSEDSGRKFELTRLLLEVGVTVGVIFFKVAAASFFSLRLSDGDGKARPLWRTARVFISSTFRDMHGERDILTRFVFPELRERAPPSPHQRLRGGPALGRDGGGIT